MLNNNEIISISGNEDKIILENLLFFSYLI